MQTVEIGNQPVADESLVFVYGSLMQGFGNHRCLGDAEFVCATTLSDGGQYDRRCFRMVSLGAFPGIVDAHPSEATTISGEVYRASRAVMADLDLLEGVSSGFYQRRVVRLDNGMAAYVYVLGGTYAERQPVPSGNWATYQREQAPRRAAWEQSLKRWGVTK